MSQSYPHLGRFTTTRAPGFRRNFPCKAQWRGKHYVSKQVEAIAVQENDNWLVITVMVKYF